MKIMQDWRRFFATVDPTQHESIGASLWDRQTYVDNTTLTLLYYTAVRTALRDGNIQIAGQLPAGIHFLVQAVKVVPIVRPRIDLAPAAPGSNTGIADDLSLLFNDGVLSIQILQKVYGQYPLFQLLPGTGVVANSVGTGLNAAANFAQTATWGNPDNRAVYTLAQPIAIPPVTNFQVRLDWAAVVNTQVGNIDLEVVLDGMLIRPKQ